MQHFKAQVAIVTGASRGIGKAIALCLAREKINLALVARSASDLRAVADQCSRHGITCLTLPHDLADPACAKTIVQQTVGALGGISYLINNAGVFTSGPAADADLEAWDRLMTINVRSVMHLTRHALPHIVAAQHGAIINIASVAGKQANAGAAAYCASKHALVGFSHALFEDVREQGIKVCAICPGYVNTDMVVGRGLVRNRAICPDDVAQAVRYVLSQSNTVCPVEIILRPQCSPERQ